jgi:hypothetical protein
MEFLRLQEDIATAHLSAIINEIMPDTFVCSNCVDDYVLQKFVQRHADGNECSYCGRESEDGKPIALNFDSMASRIRRTMDEYYEGPEQNVGNCTAEGGYDIKPMGAYDVLSGLGLDGSNEKFSKTFVTNGAMRNGSNKTLMAIGQMMLLGIHGKIFANR